MTIIVQCNTVLRCHDIITKKCSLWSTLVHVITFRSLNWIPTKILHCYYRQAPEDMLCVERCLLSCLVPVNLKPEERMERIISLYTTLEDENANKYMKYNRISTILVSAVELRIN